MDRKPDGAARLERRNSQLDLDLAIRPAKTLPGEVRRAMLDDGWISYRLARSRRRSLALYVGHDGVLAKAPLSMPLYEIESFLRQKTRWLRRRLHEASLTPLPFFWHSGARLPVLGRDVSVLAVSGHAIRLEQNCLEVGLTRINDCAELRRRTIEWLKREAAAHFRGRVNHFSSALDVRISDVSLSNARTQWGLCHEDGRVRLAWRLFHAPVELIDYVVAHEVAHLVEMNHSPRFWAVVERIYPRWRDAREALRDFGRRLPDITEDLR